MGPALVTFTARAGYPFLPVVRSEDELLAQGAMTVLALDLDTRDVILNPYPLTGPAGLSLGLMPWLISGATLAQHHPFDYAAFVEQLFGTGATVTALPPPVLAELAKDGVLQTIESKLRRLGAVWSMAELAEPPPPFHGAATLLFDLYPLGDLASVVLRRETRALSFSASPRSRLCRRGRRGRRVRRDQASPAQRRGKRAYLARSDRSAGSPRGTACLRPRRLCRDGSLRGRRRTA